MSRVAKSAQELYAEANQIKRSLKDLTGKKLFKAKKRIAALEFTARSRTGKRATTANQAQGLLPGFTSQVQPTVQEMARDLVWNALQAQIGVEIEVIKRHLKKA